MVKAKCLKSCIGLSNKSKIQLNKLKLNLLNCPVSPDFKIEDLRSAEYYIRGFSTTLQCSDNSMNCKFNLYMKFSSTEVGKHLFHKKTIDLNFNGQV